MKVGCSYPKTVKHKYSIYGMVWRVRDGGFLGRDALLVMVPYQMEAFRFRGKSVIFVLKFAS
jgi:hypothetical protein